MKKIFILLLIISGLAFSKGEISFKKQKEKLMKIEEAKLEAIKNSAGGQIQVQPAETVETQKAEKTFDDEEEVQDFAEEKTKTKKKR